MNNVLPFLNRLLYSFQDNITLWNQFEFDISTNNKVYINNIRFHNPTQIHDVFFHTFKEHKLLIKYALASCTSSVLQEAYTNIQNQTQSIIGQCKTNQETLTYIYITNNAINFVVKKVICCYNECMIEIDKNEIVLMFPIIYPIDDMYSKNIQTMIRLL